MSLIVPYKFPLLSTLQAVAASTPAVTGTFVASGAAVVWGGGFTDQTGTGSPTNGLARQMTSHGAQFDVQFTGTTVLCECFGQSDTLTITVDGTPSTISPAGSWHTEVLASGLADTTHTLTVKTSSSHFGSYFDAGTFLKIIGSAPALSLPTGFASNTGLSPATNSRFAIDGSQLTSTVEGNSNVESSSVANGANKGHGTIRFDATFTGFNVWTYQGGDKFHVLTDSATGMGTLFTLPSNGTWGWLQVTGLDNAAQHEYQLMNAKVGTGAGTYVYQIIARDGSINSAAPSGRSTWAFYGDSITDGSNITGSDFAFNFPELLVPIRKVGAYISGIAGSSVQNSFSGSSAGETRTADITSLAVKPNNLIILYGHNDALNAGYTASGMLNSYTNMLNKFVPALSGTTKIYCLGMLNTTATPASGNRTSCNTQISTAVTNVNNPQCVYVSTDGWINPATDDGDGTHPNPTGAAKIAVQLNSTVT